MASDESIVEREFKFTREDFQRIARLMYDLSGINLTEKKKDMVYSRLARHVRRLKFTEFDSYLDYVDKEPNEYLALVNSLTTNLTHFFRERHHFEYLSQQYIPWLQKRANNRIRFWSAGCSSGEEPYTMAMVWHECTARNLAIDFKILATDIDTTVLENGRAGIYQSEKLSPVDAKFRKYFSKCDDDDLFQVKDILKHDIYFKHLNLMNDWPIKGPFQLIMCRNVLIYFDRPTQERVVSKMIDLLDEEGCLMLGHSENLNVCKQRLEHVGKTIFRKVSSS